MKIKDRIYGDIDIKEQVIVDLINTAAFQRLKKISQDGAVHFIQPVRNVTRYEHSIGVWYLSSRYKRPIEEQIAALLHDLSHTAFSHVIDYVVDDKEQEYADKRLNEMIHKSEIPGILSAHGLDLERVLDKTKFPLLDNNLPDISVDRWDYFMRDGTMFGYMPKVLADSFLTNIFEKNDTFYFKDMHLASTYAILYVSFSRLIWADPTAAGAFYLLAEAIRIGLKETIVTEEDFFTDDESMMAKLKASNNTKIKELLSRLQPGKEFVYANEKDAEFSGPSKPRFVDPFVEVDGELKRLTTLVNSLSYFYKEFAEEYKVISVKADY